MSKRKKKTSMNMGMKYFKEEHNPLFVAWLFLIALYVILIQNALSSADANVQQVVAELNLSSTQTLNISFIVGFIVASILVALHFLMAWIIIQVADILNAKFETNLMELTIILIWVDIFFTVLGNILGLLLNVLGIIYIIVAGFYLLKLR